MEKARRKSPKKTKRKEIAENKSLKSKRKRMCLQGMNTKTWSLKIRPLKRRKVRKAKKNNLKRSQSKSKCWRSSKSTNQRAQKRRKKKKQHNLVKKIAFRVPHSRRPKQKQRKSKRRMAKRATEVENQPTWNAKERAYLKSSRWSTKDIATRRNLVP